MHFDEGGDWDDESFVEDYGQVLAGGNGNGFDMVGAEDNENGAYDSDSSIDLHTPLPCVNHASISTVSAADGSCLVISCCVMACSRHTPRSYPRTRARRHRCHLRSRVSGRAASSALRHRVRTLLLEVLLQAD